MNPILLIILSIVSIFLFFIYLNFYYSQFEPENILFEHDSLPCSSLPPQMQPYCLGTNFKLFPKIIKSYSNEQIEKEMTDWLSSSNLIKNKIKVKYSESRKSFEALATEDLLYSEKLISFNESMVFHRTCMNKTYFHSINETELARDVEILAKIVKDVNANPLVFVLLYHLVRIDQSIFKPWLLTLPSYVDNLLKRLTPYEYKTFIKTNREIAPFVKEYLEKGEKEWKAFEKFMNKKLPNEEVRKSLFNGYTISKDDYIWTRFMVETTAWTVGNKNEIILFPGINLIRRKNSEDASYDITFQQQRVERIGETSDANIEFVINRPTRAGEPILQQFTDMRGFISLLIYDELPIPSYVDCINAEIYFYENTYNLNSKAKELLSWAAEGGSLCLQNNTFALVRLQIVGDIMNMNEDEIEECYKHFSVARNLQEKYSTFMQICAKKKWTSFDPKKIPLRSLNQSRAYFEKYENEVKEYLDKRESYWKDARNAHTLLKYTQERIKLIDTLAMNLRNVTNLRMGEGISVGVKDKHGAVKGGVRIGDEEEVKKELQEKERKGEL